MKIRAVVKGRTTMIEPQSRLQRKLAREGVIVISRYKNKKVVGVVVNYPTLMLRIQKRASQFIGNCRQNSVALLVLHCLQGQKSWFPRPIFFLATYTDQLGFRVWH